MPASWASKLSCFCDCACGRRGALGLFRYFRSTEDWIVILQEFDPWSWKLKRSRGLNSKIQPRFEKAERTRVLYLSRSLDAGNNVDDQHFNCYTPIIFCHVWLSNREGLVGVLSLFVDCCVFGLVSPNFEDFVRWKRGWNGKNILFKGPHRYGKCKDKMPKWTRRDAHKVTNRQPVLGDLQVELAGSLFFKVPSWRWAPARFAFWVATAISRYRCFL